MENLSHFSDAQRHLLDKLSILKGAEHASLVVAQGQDMLNTGLDTFLNFEITLIGQVHD